MRKLLVLLFLVGCSGAVHIENDILQGGKTKDENFTHGTKFSYFKETENEKETYSIGQNIYTPFRKKPDAPIGELLKDRPYAGFLYAEYRNTTFISESLKDTFGFAIGCVGPCSLAKQTQRQVHRWLQQTIPTWDRSFTQKSEPGAILEAERSYQFAKNDWSDFDIYSAIKAGNIIDNVAFGIDARVGWNLDKFASEPIIFKVPEYVNPWTLYFFARAEDRFVAYNHMLDGSLFQTERHTVNSNWSVSEADIGFTVGWKKLKFTYRFTIFSPEWDGAPGAFSFGGLDFSW